MQLNVFEAAMAASGQTWTAPPGRDLLRLRDMDATVRPLFDPGAPQADRQQRRAETLEFLQGRHYRHLAPDAKEPLMTWSFGLYLNRQLAGVVVLNPPAAGVSHWLYGTGSPWIRQVIGVTRTVCAPEAPFNSESFMVSAAMRLLPRVDHRFAIAVAHSDLGVFDPDGKAHVGQIYMASNAWWAGHSATGQWRGFYNPETGARLSRKNGARNRSRSECPPGWLIEDGAALTRFLWFVGPLEEVARTDLVPSVQVSIREGAIPVWRRPAFVKRSTTRAYSAEDKSLRQSVTH